MSLTVQRPKYQKIPTEMAMKNRLIAVMLSITGVQS
jgi:hypothetical protein